MSDMFKGIEEFEAKLNLPNGFYTKLLKEDDWSFVIKLNALFEAACTHILTIRLRSPKIEGALSHLEQGNTRCGKIVLLKHLGAITSDQSVILNALARLRNELVHNIANAGFTFGPYIDDLNKENKKNFVKRFGHGLQDELSIKGKLISRRDFVLANPKVAIWLTSAEVLACLYLEIESTALTIQREALVWYTNLTK